MSLTEPFTTAVAKGRGSSFAGAEIHPHRTKIAPRDMTISRAASRRVCRWAWAYDKSHPVLRDVHRAPITKMGLDNPDTLYYHANIEDSAEYLITGTRAIRSI